MKNKNRKGMTLLEVILAMAIFGIVASSFLTMFTSSLIWIFGAGDRGEAYSMSQSDVESSIAEGDSYETDDLVIRFGTDEYTIQGGLVESTQTVNQKDSTLKTFVPSLPTILLNPKVRYEGDQATLVEIEGINTNFNTSTIVEIFDQTGNTQIGNTIDADVTSDTEASFELIDTFGDPINLLNNDYIIRVKTNITGEPDQVSRARYTITQPRFLIGGSNSVYISADGKDWLNRASIGSFPLASDFNSAEFNGDRYVLVGDYGLILYSTEKNPWQTTTAATENFTDIIWSSELGKFFAVGNSGGIYTSDEGTVFQRIHLSTNVLNGVESIEEIDGTDRLVAVGENEIAYSTTGDSWITVESGTFVFKDVAAKLGLFVAVGDNVIGLSNNGSDWNISYSPHLFEDIVYLSGEGRFIAVGDGGVIMYSNDGINWTSSSIDHDISTTDLNGVHSRASVVVVVGNGGTVLFSDNSGSSFELLGDLSITDDLQTVTGE